MRGLAGRLRRRPTVTAAVLSLLLSAVMVAPAFLPGRVLSSADNLWQDTPWTASRPAGFVHPASPDLEDAVQQFQPFRLEVKRQLPGAPLWDPWLEGGRPLLADAQSAPFSPFNVPAWIMSSQGSLVWIALLVLWAATFGMYGLGRALGMRFGGAMMAGIAYGLSLWIVSHVSYPHDATWAMFPWLLWASERVLRRPDPTAVGLLGLAVGVQFACGHPETSFDILLGTLGFFAIRLGLAYRGRYRWREVRAPLIALAAGLVGGTGLAAIVLLPFGELLFHSADLAGRSGKGVDQHLNGNLLIGFFLYDYWGRATHTALAPFLFARSWYVGALPLMLAAIAVMRRSAERLLIAGAGVLLLLVIFGVPPFLQIATHLPLLSLGHNDRLILLVLAGLALLAGWGFDDLASEAGIAHRRRAIAGVAGAVLVLPLVMVLVRGDIGSLVPREAVKVAFEIARPPAAGSATAVDAIRSASVVVWLCVAGASLLLVVLRLRGLSSRWFVGLALALVVVDLVRAGMGYNPAIPASHANQPVTGALRYLAAQRPARFVGMGNVAQNVVALRQRLQDAGGYEVPILKRYNHLWRREVSPEYPDLTSTFVSLFLQVPRLDERRLRTLRLLGVRDLLVPPAGTQPAPAGLDTPGLTRVYDGPDAQVLRVDGALPRTFVAGTQRRVAGGEAALDAITRPGFDARGVAVTERTVNGVPQTGPGGPAGSSRIVSYAPSRVTIDARLTRPGMVMLSDNWFPGWKATVDGRSADVERVDYVMRGVVAGRGHHRIVFTYQPASWRIGWIVSLLSLFALAGAILVGRRRGSRVAGKRPEMDRREPLVCPVTRRGVEGRL